MEKKYIVIVGYTKLTYLTAARTAAAFSDYTFICAYRRPANTPAKISYLAQFDQVFNLQEPTDRQKLSALAANVAAITCTQERDIVDYIEVQHLLHKISSEIHAAWKTAIDKHALKNFLREMHPELVPAAQLAAPDTTVQFPAIIKPLGFTGSAYVAIVTNQADYNHYFSTVPDKIFNSTSVVKYPQFIVEEYLSGPQFSVNVYINNSGESTFCPTIRVIPASELGANDCYSALQYVTTELSSDELSALYNCIKKIISTFSIRNTSAHFDIIKSPKGFKFLEVGLRIGGLRQEIFAVTHNFNHFVNDLKNRLGLPITLPPQAAHICIVQKASCEEGVLRNVAYQRIIANEDAAYVAEHKFRKFGTLVGPVRAGGGVIARFLVTGKNSSAVINTAHQLYTTLKLPLSK